MDPLTEARCWLSLAQGGGDEDADDPETGAKYEAAIVGGLLLGDIRRAFRRGE